MAPVTKAGAEQFRKDVDFVVKDEAEQRAAGIVMVPDKVDLQNDFAREDTIRAFADQFGNFVEAGEGSGGVMHAAWPAEWMALERNEVLDESQDIGGQPVEAGAWVQEWQFEEDDLWGLVADGILEGYSIGAVNVDWNGPFDQDADAVDDVEVPDEIGEDELIWELASGLIREVSAVDIPAVPDAQILETKADAEKRLADHLGNRDAFIDEAMERGHTESEAERLWEVLHTAIDIEGAGEPGKLSFFERIGKAAVGAFTGSDDGDSPSPEALDAATADATKEGRTLSTANRDAVMASIDAGLDVLHDAGVEDLPTRFTDRDDVDFDLDEHSARTWTGDHGDGDGDGDEEEEAEASANHATGGDTPDDTTMTDDDTPDDPWAEAPEWAKDLRDRQAENSERIDDLAGDGDDTKNADADGDDDPWAEAPEWAKALKEAQEANTERIDNIAKQSGHSQQLDDTGSGDGEDETGLDALGKALS